VERHQYHQGPLPPAQELSEYDRVHPGLAERIVRMAEAEQQHRHGLERTEVQEPFRLARRGQVCGVAVVVLVLAFATFLAVNGHVAAASIITGLNLVGLVIVFVTGQSPPSGSGSQEIEKTDSAKSDGEAAPS
jgi:uncharacterized membrane protein